MGDVKSKVRPYELLLNNAQMMSKVITKDTNFLYYNFFNAMIPFLSESLQNVEAGWPTVATTFGFPRELLSFFDIVPVNIEGISYTMGDMVPGGIGAFYDAMSAFGHPIHTCSAQKGTMGLNLEGWLDFDFVVTPSGQCDNTVASLPVFRYLQKDNPPEIKILDMPYYRDERSIEYFKNEIYNFIDEMSHLLNQKPNEEKFRKGLEVENKSILLRHEINELKKAKPCPFESAEVPMNAATHMYLTGLPQKVTYLEGLYEYGKKNYKNKSKPMGSEKIRTIWPNMTIYFDRDYCDYLDTKNGVSVLFDVFTYLHQSPIDLDQDLDGVLKDLALNCMNYPMTRQVQGFAEKIIEDTIFLVREFDIDAAIFTNHVACKSLGPVVQLLREALREEVGIPMLSIDVDVGDKRFTNLEIIKNKVNTFVETLF